MGTTLNKLEYLDTTKSQIKTALNQFNEGITDNDTFRSYVNKINNIYDNWEKVTGEGTSITLTPTKKGKLDFEDEDGKKKIGYGDTKQKSTTGKNILDSSTIQQKTENGITCTYNSATQEITLNGTSTGDAIFHFVGVSLNMIANQTTATVYRISGTCTTANASFDLYDENYNKQIIIRMQNISTQVSGTVTESYTSVINRIRVSQGCVCNNYKFKVMVANSTNTDYEPYTNGASPNPSYPQDIEVVTGTQTVYIKDENNNIIDTKTINLGEYEFAKIGNYVDTIEYDVENDKVYKNEKVGKIVLDGSSDENWQMDYSTGFVSNRFTCDNLPSLDVTSQTNFDYGYCNIGKITSEANYSTYLNVVKLRYINNQNRVDCMFDIESLNAFKTLLAQTPMEIYYQRLGGAELTEITDTTLKDQIKALYNSQSFNGTTIIEIEGDLPIIIKVKALKGVSE